MKRRILVVDDESSILELLRYKLSNRGFEVVTATNAWEFWGEALSAKPDLIILDIWLKGKLGTEVYNELLTNGLDSDIPVIFITALLEDRPPSHARPGIQYALYGKPFDFDELMKGIDCLLEESHKNQA
ncbi:MAG: response regulator [Candidatus Omnitrophica bacterium]|nr:response regulator [Candidatus Omnitrophota bacterium]